MTPELFWLGDYYCAKCGGEFQESEQESESYQAGKQIWDEEGGPVEEPVYSHIKCSKEEAA